MGTRALGASRLRQWLENYPVEEAASPWEKGASAGQERASAGHERVAAGERGRTVKKRKQACPTGKKGQRQARSFFFFFPSLINPPPRTTTLHVQVRPLLLKSSTSTWSVVVGGGFPCAAAGRHVSSVKPRLRFPGDPPFP